MAEITATMVKSLRERTGLPMMECKRALQECNGDENSAVELLRKQGKKTMEKRAGRETGSGRIGIYADVAAGVGAMVELQCESDPVAKHEEFIALAKDLAQQLATGPGAGSPEELLAQSSPSKSSHTLAAQMDDLNNRIREVFKLERIIRIDAPCGGYAHHSGVNTLGVLVEVAGGDQQTANEIAMHVAAAKPTAVRKEDVDADIIEKERAILREAALKEGKPENIVEKMIEGRMRTFYETCVLVEQPFVKDETQTVGKMAKAAGLEIKRFVIWELGKS